MQFLKKAHEITLSYQILFFYLKKQQSYKGGHNAPPPDTVVF